MRRCQLVEPQKPLQLNEIPIPEPPRRGAVVKNIFSGICHSDNNFWCNELDHGNTIKRCTDNPNYKLPLTLGHEMAGEVYSLGADADAKSDDLSVGDHVIVYPWIGCNKCGFCKNDASHLCDHRYHGLGIGNDGGYATHVIVCEKRFLVKVPSSIPMHVAAMLPCAGLTTYNAVTTAKPAVEKTTTFKGKASLLVVGAGGLGLWCIQIAKHVLPSTTRIVAADVFENSLKNAKEQGCHDTVLWDMSSSEEELVARTKSKSYDGGFDAVIDLVNSKVTSERAFNCTHRGSLMVMVGLYGGAARVSLPGMVHGVRNLRGVLTGTLQQLKDLVELVAEKQLKPPPLRYFTLDEADYGLSLVREGKMHGRGLIKHQ